MCCPKRTRTRICNASSRSRANPCGSTRYFKIARILVVSFVLIAFTWYTSDRTYCILKKELDSLNNHISYMEDFLRTYACKKGDVESKMKTLAETLPQIKRLANNLRIDVDKCHEARGRKTDFLRNIIKEELELYNADKIGRTDFALETSGGKILTTKDTPSFSTKGAALTIFGIPLCPAPNNPRALIQPGNMPGDCWAFKGTKGTAIIKLIRHIYVTGFSLEHIPKSISPSGSINTAPKEFAVLGLEHVNDQNSFLFGKYKYKLGGNTIQYFPVCHKSSQTFNIVEFRVLSNHGNKDYTCVYRFRVHGYSK